MERKMKSVDLAINKEYLAGQWTYVEAIREIVQNCIDAGQHEIRPQRESSTIDFITHAGPLHVADLALGTTSKAADSTKIGEYGEGLKVGFVALLRDGCSIVIKNYDQVWTPYFEVSSALKCVTLHVRIEKAAAPTDCLDIEVGDIPDLDALAQTSVDMMGVINGVSPTNASATPYGTIMRDPQYADMVYVGGLFVQRCEGLGFGIDFAPDKVHLDRDRKLIDFPVLMKLVAETLVEEGDIDAINRALDTDSMHREIISAMAEGADYDLRRAFCQDYLSHKDKSAVIANISDGKIPELELPHVLAISPVAKKYLSCRRALLESIQKNASTPIAVVVEGNEDMRKLINGVGDGDYFAYRLESDATDWSERGSNEDQVRETLRNFNSSGYKKTLKDINELCERYGISWTDETLLRIKNTALDGLSTWGFDLLLPYIDEKAVTDEDYVMDQETINEIRTGVKPQAAAKKGASE